MYPGTANLGFTIPYMNGIYLFAYIPMKGYFDYDHGKDNCSLSCMRHIQWYDGLQLPVVSLKATEHLLF